MTADQPDQPGKPDGPGQPHHLDPFEPLDHPHDAKLDGEVLRSKALITSIELPERVGYRFKRLVLGPPIVTEQIHDEKLSKKAALGVLSSDCISSSAYGSEEMLIVLLPVFGLAGFHLLMPMTAVVLGLLVITTLSYREVVMIYTKAGGSYVVARENFGPKVAQIASVALLIDYIVTVAVQAAAGTAAITLADSRAEQGSSSPRSSRSRSCWSLRTATCAASARRARRSRCPTYFFVAAAGPGRRRRRRARDLRGPAQDRLPRPARRPNSSRVNDLHHAIFSAAAIFVLLKAFANGGASLTGLEAISNGVSAFKRPEGLNARKTLTIMSMLLGTLVLGISFLAWRTNATPYTSGSPTVISQVARRRVRHRVVRPHRASSSCRWRRR